MRKALEDLVEGLRQPRVARRVGRTLAGVLILAQAAIAFASLPLEDRRPLAPDDLEVLRFADAIRDHGLPVIPYDDLEVPGISTYPVFGPAGTHLNSRDELYSPRPPGIFFVHALDSGGSMPTVYAVQSVFVAASLIVFHLLVERWLGPWAAVLATMTLAFHAAFLFWSTTVFSNVVALGVLAGAVWLLGDRRPTAQVAGGAALVACILFRFEFVILVGAVVAARAWLAWKEKQERHPGLLALAGAATAALLIALLALRLYDTVDLISVSRNPAGAGNSLSVLEEGTRGSSLEKNADRYSLMFLASMLGIPALFLVARAPGSPTRRDAAVWCGLGIAMLLFVPYILSSGFAGQRFLLLNSYTRYLLPVVLVGAVGWGALWVVLAGRGARAVLVAALAANAGFGVAIAQGPDGFEGAQDLLDLVRAEAAGAAELPPDAILLGDHSSFWVRERPVVSLQSIPRADRVNETTRIVQSLLDEGHQVYASKFLFGSYRQYYEHQFRRIDSPSDRYWELVSLN